MGITLWMWRRCLDSVIKLWSNWEGEEMALRRCERFLAPVRMRLSYIAVL
jgi:hypothetical protein